MSELALQIENLGKQYRLGVIGTGTLSHDLNRWWYQVRGKQDPYLKVGEVNDRSAKGESEYVWALRHIDLNVNQGEIVGVIGSNGAGKSTLLKILSRVTSPTEGLFRARGRTASLLEVGTGFHAELTGRENIYLNGAILGMTKPEITSKLDEIVDFSGVERYIDTPVKRYSSGMTVRLAFAVAAHLEPEILIVDEVLAVGDSSFQKKAVGKIKSVSQGSGRTVLFVSHNMGAVTKLCDRGIVLKNGEIDFEGDIHASVQHYEEINADVADINLSTRKDRGGIGDFRFQDVMIENHLGQEMTNVRTGSQASIHVKIKATGKVKESDVYAAVCFRDALGNRLFTLSTSLFDTRVTLDRETLLTFEIKRMPLSAGNYLCDLYIAEGRGDALVQDHVERAFTVTVYGNDYFDSGDSQPEGLDRFYTDFEVIKNRDTKVISMRSE